MGTIATYFTEAKIKSGGQSNHASGRTTVKYLGHILPFEPSSSAHYSKSTVTFQQHSRYPAVMAGIDRNMEGLQFTFELSRIKADFEQRRWSSQHRRRSLLRLHLRTCS